MKITLIFIDEWLNYEFSNPGQSHWPDSSYLIYHFFYISLILKNERFCSLFFLLFLRVTCCGKSKRFGVTKYLLFSKPIKYLFKIIHSSIWKIVMRLSVCLTWCGRVGSLNLLLALAKTGPLKGAGPLAFCQPSHPIVTPLCFQTKINSLGVNFI